MAPRVNTNPAKAAAILAWFHKTAVAHSIKDLEKAIPQVASINGMQVKDYLQSLADDSKIRVEKIGSGNWYWSFPSDEKRAKDVALEKAQEDHGRAQKAVLELQAETDEAEAARADGEGILTELGVDRQSLLNRHVDLSKHLAALRLELAAYSEQDPVEIEKKEEETRKLRDDAQQYTYQIQSMVKWLEKNVIYDGEEMQREKRNYFGDEFDEEEGDLREIEHL